MQIRRTDAVSTFSALLFLILPLSGFSQSSIVINEIHYNPDISTERVEFIELYNNSSSPVDIAGWRFTEGIEYTFPPGTTVAGQGYVVVTEDPADFQAKFGRAALGPWEGRLNNDGEDIVLRNAQDVRVDEVDYQLGFPWPIVGDTPGYSIELIHPDLDNSLGGSWRVSVVGGGFEPPDGIDLVPARSTWKYFKGLSEASSPIGAWRDLDFNDSNPGVWPTGGLPIGYGEPALSFGTTLSDMQGGYSSVYLRKKFVVDDPSIIAGLKMEVVYDDGFKAWINGVNVINNQANMASGDVPYNQTALSQIENTSFVTFDLPNPTYLVPGTNIIAIQAHNGSLGGSSDFFIDLRLVGEEQGATMGVGPTPGARNAIYATNSPPQIRQVDHSPNQPMTGETVTITAKVTDPDGVAAVSLQYQLVNPGGYLELTDAAYTNTWSTLPMADGGAGGDEAAGDDVYTVQLPGTFQMHRRLVRYRITIEDQLGNAIQVPYPDDMQPNFAYFCYDGVPGWEGSIRPGVEPVLQFSAEEMGRLPTYHLIAKKTTVENATWFDRYSGDQYRYLGTLIYDGEVYDHVRFRMRGGVWRFSMVKNMWKFRMNRGHYFQARDDWGREYPTKWRRVNFGASIQQGDFNHRGEQGMFESTGFRFFNLAGVEAPFTTYISYRIIDEAQEAFPGDQFEGDFWGVYLLIEQMDGRWMDAHGLPDGNLYKMENGTGPPGATGEIKNQGPFQVDDYSDVIDFQNLLNTSRDETWWRTHLDVDRYIDYYTIVQGIHHYDICCGKNYYFYFNPTNGLCQVHPWDLDLTWADNMYEAGDGGTDEIYDRGQPFNVAGINLQLKNRVREILDLLWNDDQAFRVLEEHAALLQGPATGPTLLAADRAMWDYNPKMNSGTYTPNVNKAQTGRFYQFPNESGTNSTLRGSFDALVEIMKHYVTRRARATSYPSGTPLSTWERDTQIPATPSIAYVGAGSFPINELEFRVGNYSGVNAFAALKWRIAEVTPSDAPAANPEEPNKYEIQADWESAEIAPFSSDVTIPVEAVRAGSTYRVRARFKDATGRWSHWSPPVEFRAGQPAAAARLLASLRVTEIMADPPDGGDYEFVELHNTSAEDTLNLLGAKFTQGIDFLFPPGTEVPPGGYLVVMAHPDPAAFRAYYGLGPEVPITGPYTGSLANEGESLVLRTAAGGTDIVAFDYGEGRGWPVTTRGTGHSLIPLKIADQTDGSLNYGGNWRASTYLLGSPGGADPASPDAIVINEIATHTDFPLPPPEDSNDWIELYNAGAGDFTFGPGWYLSDSLDPGELTKWMIPAGTVISAGGFVSFDERNDFNDPAGAGFGLNKAGEQVLLSYLPGTAEDRVVDAVEFKGQENDWSLGRHPDGAPYLHALAPRTEDAANASPSLGVVMSEMMYHPPDLAGGEDNELDEYIEIHNPTGASVSLFDTNGTWRLDGAVDFVFPPAVSLPPSGYLLVVSFDPDEGALLDAFRAAYGLPAGLMIYGPYGGKLANRSDDLRLEKPQAGDLPGEPVNWVIVDEVIYADRAPWPQGADGLGPSLQRRDPLVHGSDPSNWAAAAPSPTAALAGGTPPSIVSQPGPAQLTTGAGSVVTYTISAAGTEPLSFQWLFNGRPMAGATSDTLELDFVLPLDSGTYQAVVMNSAGSAVSDPVELFVTTPPEIVTQPVGDTVRPGESVSFFVTANGSGALGYQWQKNGENIPGATGFSYSIESVQAEDQGTYVVVVSDEGGLMTSQPAVLTVLIPPTVIAPLEPVQASVIPGSDLTLSVSVDPNATLPVYYRWRRGFVTLFQQHNDAGPGVFRLMSHTHTVTIPDLQPEGGTTINVVISNAAFIPFFGDIHTNAVLSFVMDGDMDGIDDAWEDENGLDRNDPTDAGLDSDGDGIDNLGEYQSGTDPQDPGSYLRIEHFEADFEINGTVSISFFARANKTYSIEYRDSLLPGDWTKLRDVLGSAVDEEVTVVDQPSEVSLQRYYRLATPSRTEP